MELISSYSLIVVMYYCGYILFSLPWIFSTSAVFMARRLRMKKEPHPPNNQHLEASRNSSLSKSPSIMQPGGRPWLPHNCPVEPSCLSTCLSAHPSVSLSFYHLLRLFSVCLTSCQHMSVYLTTHRVVYVCRSGSPWCQ